MITHENTKTLYDLLKNAGSDYASRIFLQYEKAEVFYCNTYSELYKDSCSFGAWVAEQGEAPHIALLGKCSYRYLNALFGTVSAGGIAVPIDVKAGTDGIIERINKADTDILLFDWDFHDELDLYKEKCPNVKEFVCIQNMGEQSVHSICKAYRNNSFSPRAKEDNCALIIFTSGTTGKGKGVMLSHGNLIDNIFNSTEVEKQDNEVALNVLPIHHVFCLSGDVFLTMRYGSKLCLCPDSSKLFQYITVFKPTVLRAVPMISKTIYNRIVMLHRKNKNLTRRQIKDDLLGPNFHKIISGGGYLAKDLALNLIGLGITIGQGYGMSECSPKIAAPDYERLEKLDSVGRLVEGCEVRFVEGEIQVKSPSVMMGYYKDEELTKEALTDDGWLMTGDLGYADDEDFLYLTGRKKNLIILSNGENVAPEGIENLFDDEVLIKDILVYADGDAIAAAVYPNFEYANQQNINDVESAVNDLINIKNVSLPTSSQIMKCTVRKHPFKKTSSNKIIREQFFMDLENEEQRKSKLTLPVTDTQKKLCELVSGVIGENAIGTTDDFYSIGLDSMGSVMLIEELDERFNVSISLSELIKNNTVLMLEEFINSKKSEDSDLDYSLREEYPLTNMQMYFAYIIKGNTTGNLPFLYKLDNAIDLEKLKKAVLKTLDVHPILKANIHFNGQMLMTYRDDSKVIDIPIEKMSDADWEKKKETLITAFKYTEDDDLIHSGIYITDSANYFFIDVAHIIADGISIGIILNDINKIYCGEEVEKEKYSFYEFALLDNDRRTNGTRTEDIKRTAKLMEGATLNRSILNKRLADNSFEKKYSVISSRFDKITRKEILYYCKQNGVSENVMFLTAFNYLIYLFSGQSDVFSNSIHSGRTDSRYAHTVGSFFITYFCRFTRKPHETVIELLKKTASQIMSTMKNTVSNARQGEMFFQYQGDILGIKNIGDKKAERYHLQLDSLPFHMQVFNDDKGYYQELRYYENRFDEDLLRVFLNCYEHILIAMLEETSVRRLKRHLPEEVYPKHIVVSTKQLNDDLGYRIVDARRRECKVYVLDEAYKKKPFGSWGRLYIKDLVPISYSKVVESSYSEGDLYETDIIARIMPDGSVDFLENNGRTVITDGVHGIRKFYLKDVENAVSNIDGVSNARAYLYFDPEINEMSLAVDLESDSKSADDIICFMKDNYEESMVPKIINIV
ncbi:MAG: AMP-binding protein [Lachnospiraceae bacterium]|nr:AMP-binding protein [Lachnospiraceae bacterium]